jgi:hypothetical protein
VDPQSGAIGAVEFDLDGHYGEGPSGCCRDFDKAQRSGGRGDSQHRVVGRTARGDVEDAAKRAEAVPLLEDGGTDGGLGSQPATGRARRPPDGRVALN